MSYDDRHTDIMSAFFNGKLREEITNLSKEPKMVELGHGGGIGHKDGTYDQYVKQLRDQAKKGNGSIELGKAIKTEKDTLSIQDPTDKFSTDDVPKLLIMFNTILNPIQLQVIWKDSNNEKILDQYYEIPPAHGNDYDWWDSYGVWFIGPEELDEGDYKIEITSKEFGIEDKIKTSKALIEFSVESWESITANLDYSNENREYDHRFVNSVLT